MKHRCLIVCLIGFMALNVQALIGQEVASKERKPLLLDKATLSGLGLQKVPLKDNPDKDFFQKNLYRGEDLSVYVVSSESGVNSFSNFPFDEFIQILHGQATVLPDTEAEQHFYSRDFFFAPKGFTGEWSIEAGDNFHYELSVIATRRADSGKASSPALHQLYSNEKLSGAHIELDEKQVYEETLTQGAELTVLFKAEKSRTEEINQPSKEQLIHLLSGSISLTSSSGETQQFFTGDYFVIPKGFTGHWKSEGHSILKYLAVEASN